MINRVGNKGVLFISNENQRVSQLNHTYCTHTHRSTYHA